MSARQPSNNFLSSDSESEQLRNWSPGSMKPIHGRPLSPYVEVPSRPKPSVNLIGKAPSMLSNTDKIVESIDPNKIKPVPTPALRRSYWSPSGVSKIGETVEDLKLELKSSKNLRQASLRSCKEAQSEVQESKIKERALIDRVTRADNQLASMTTLYKEAVKSKQEIVIERDDAIYARDSLNLQVKELEEDAKELQTQKALSDKAASKTEEILTTLCKKLQDSEENRGTLVGQVEQLMADNEELSKEKDLIAKFAKRSQDATAAHQEAVNAVLKELDGQLKTGAAQIRQLKEEVKNVCREKAAFMCDQDKEMVKMGAKVERLLLENAELEEEVQLYKEDCGVMVLEE